MCGPALPLFGMAVSAAGSIFSGMSQAAGYKAQAESQRMQAQADANAGSYESARQIDKIARMQGQQVTAVAGMGVDLAGSPMDVISDSRTEGEMDKAAIRSNWQQRSNIATFQSKVSDMNAGSAMTGGFIGALAPIIKGAGKLTGTAGAFG